MAKSDDESDFVSSVEAVPSYGSVVQRESKLQRQPSYTLRTPRCTFFAEPLLAAMFFTLIGSYPLIQQFIYTVAARDYPSLANHTQNASSVSEACLGVNSTDSERYKDLQKIQARTSWVMMLLNILSTIPAILANLIIGGYSDKFHRKPALYLPTVGLTMVVIVVTAVIYFDLPIYVLYVAYFINGCFGGTATLLTGCFAYIADVVKPEQRAFRMVFLDVILALSGAAAESLLGFLIKAFGFVVPSLVNVSIAVLALIYAMFIIPEPHSPLPGTTFSLKESLTATYNVYAKKDPRRPRLVLVICIILFPQLVVAGTTSVSTLFQMNSPLCWGPALIGTYLAVALFVIQFGSLFGSVVFIKCLKMPEVYVCLIGNISGMAANIYYSTVTKTWEVFLVPVIAMFELLPMPLARAIGSKLVHPSEQGALFSGMGLVYGVASICSSIGFNSLYNATLDLFHGTVFLVCAVCFLVSFIFTCVYIVYDKRTSYVRMRTVNRTG